MGWNPDEQPPGWQPDGWQPGPPGAVVAAPIPGRRFRIRLSACRRKFAIHASAARRRFAIQYVGATMSSDAEYRFDDVIKNAGEQYPVELDLYELVVSKRLPNEYYAQNDYVRPEVSNGFAYRAVNAGLTSSLTPRFTASLNTITPDGEIQWECVAQAGRAIVAITTTVATPSPADLTVTGAVVTEDWKIAATYEGGTAGIDYLVKWTFVVEARTRIAHQLVKVKTV